jgi:hypothetical protein
MSMKSGTFTAYLLVGIASFVTPSAIAQNNRLPTTATRPSPNGPEQTSVPNNAPPASRTQITGQTNQDAMTKEMNTKEKDKIEQEGK